MDDDKPDSSSTASTQRRAAANPETAGSFHLVGDSATDIDANQDRRTDNEFVNRVADSLHETVDQLSTAAAPHVQQLQDGIGDFENQVHVQADQVRDWSTQCTVSLRASVREHPLAALGTAFVIGLLLARLAL